MIRRRKTIRVRYPLEGGSIGLRTDDDGWHEVHSPVDADPVEGSWDFHVETTRPWFYFRPTLTDRGRTMFSRNRYLALMTASELREVFPHFGQESRSSRFDRLTVPGSSSGDAHEVTVWLPPGYGENNLCRYPVIYMQDGPNLFFPDEAFGGEPWAIDHVFKTLDSMNAVRKTIVIGVHPSTPELRMEEYTQPGYQAYGRYVVEDLRAEVEGRYRTLSGPANTAVMGSSLGGVVSFYLAWQYPNVFGMAGCMSSTFGHRDDLLERVADEEKRNIRLYLDSGWPGDNYEVTRAMRGLLIRRGFVSGLDLLYFVFPRERHSERAWGSRSHIPFQFFFGR